VSEVRVWLQELKTLGMRQNLETTGVLLARLEMPHLKFPSIHVAGSNGKGTTSVIIANALSLSGVNCGLFTSPHLCFVEERVRVDGVPISSQSFDLHLQRIRDVAQIKPVTMPTFYEATFLVAMLAFADAGVDRAVIETGLGGRLDSTRMVHADCCVLTELALEHTDVLGSTLGEIAAEKAAIARPGEIFLAKWTYDNEARKAIKDAVSDHSLGFWWRPDRALILRFDDADESHRPIPNIAMPSDWSPYHKEASILAHAALTLLGCREAAMMIPSALLHTVWPGRVQWIEHHDVPILLDAAHNPSGMEKMCNQLRLQMESDEAPTPGVIVLGCTPQTDLVAFLNPIVELIVEGEVEHIIVTEPKKGRRPAISVTKLANELESQGVSAAIERIPDPNSAIHRALEISQQDANIPILAIGSLYLVGNLLKSFGLDTVEAMTTLRSSEDGKHWT
jgi:dihydrofolate synthase/folylpolyglutamate synthase